MNHSTHPKTISESLMGSKCLIVDARLYDMEAIFDYDPIIPIDEHDPPYQLLDILKTTANTRL